MDKRPLIIGALALVLVLVGTALFLNLGPFTSTASGPRDQAQAGQQDERSAGPGEILGNQEAVESNTENPVQEVEVGTAVGQRAPDFSLTDLEGKGFSLGDLRGKPVILHFSAAWCPSCIPETEALARIKSDYGEKVEIVWIDVDPQRDSPEDLRRLAEEHGGDFIYAFDDGNVALEFEVRALGTTYILDEQGIIRYRDFGPTGYEVYARELEGLLPGSSPSGGGCCVP